MSEYTPDISGAQSYYVAGRAQLRRQITGEQAIDVTEYSHEFNRWLAKRDAEVAAKAWSEGWSARASRGYAHLKVGECVPPPAHINPYREGGAGVILDNTVVYLQKIATLARESQSQGHIIGYPRYENEVYVLNDLHADDLEAASTKMLALLDRVEKAERALQRVRERHQARMNSMSALYPEPLCSCQSIYPCPTIRALEGNE